MVKCGTRTTFIQLPGPARIASAIGVLGLALLAFTATAQTPPGGLPDRGVLRLQMGRYPSDGGLHTPKRFIHEPSGLSQSLDVSGTCILVLGGPTSLANLSAIGGLGLVGKDATALGVADRTTNPSCSRITASLGEALIFGLGSDITASPQIDATAFWRLSLDVEMKKDAEFLLQILAKGAVADEFRLRTGARIVAGEGSSTAGSPDHILNCTTVPDSSSDSRPGDNCRWVVDSLGDSFRLVAVAGEGSLEGGGDFSSRGYANNSLIYLTEATVGALGCESNQVPQDNNTSTIGDGGSTAQCGVTRVDPTGLGGSCTSAVGYALRNVDGLQEGCELTKNSDEELAGSIDILFPPETATAIGSEPLTKIDFSTPVPGVMVSFTPQRCIGTVVPDRNGEPTIAEVLSVPGFVTDVVPATPQKDWACVLNNTQEFVGSGLMQIRQTILFWGDIAFSRQAQR